MERVLDDACEECELSDKSGLICVNVYVHIVFNKYATAPAIFRWHWKPFRQSKFY